jgi:hypothetical protein
MSTNELARDWRVFQSPGLGGLNLLQHTCIRNRAQWAGGVVERVSLTTGPSAKAQVGKTLLRVETGLHLRLHTIVESLLPTWLNRDKT